MNMVYYAGWCALLVASLATCGYCCTPGWQEHGNSCYHFSHDTENFIGAVNFCKSLKGHIVEINTPEENIYLESQARRLNRTAFWIGLTDVLLDGKWVWINSDTPLTSTGVSDWSPGEPNNYFQGEENCACLLKETGYRWNDAPCKWVEPHYICEKENSQTEQIG